MKPSIGRIVHFIEDGWVRLPAIIVAVNDHNTTVDLQVFQHSEGGLTLVRNVPEVAEDPESPRWEWPPRVQA